MPWNSLSERGLWILQNVAWPLSLGLSQHEVEQRHELPGRAAGRLLKELRDEILRLVEDGDDRE